MNVARRGQLWQILGILMFVAVCRVVLAVPAAVGPNQPPSVLGALFLSCLTSQVGLVAAWVALADRVFWAVRAVTALVFGIAIYWCLNAWSRGGEREFVPVYVSQFIQVVIALALLRWCGFRFTRLDLPAPGPISSRQFSLKKLLLFTSLVAATLAIGRAVAAAWELNLRGGFLALLISVGCIFAAITVVAVVAVLAPRQPLLWGLLSCLLSLTVGVVFMLLRGSGEVAHAMIFAGPGLMQLAVMCVLRWRGWRLIRPQRAALERESPAPSLRAEHEVSSVDAS